MQRLGAVFIAICMVAISVSVGAILHFKFGLTLTEASPFSFGILLTLLLVHYQISRVRDRMMLDEQMDDLTRLKLALTKEVQDVREMALEMEQTVAQRLEKEVEPILAELDVIGALVKQLAESCADLDDRVRRGDYQVADVNAKLTAATASVKELEEHLRANMRSLSAKSQMPSGIMAFPEAPVSITQPQETFAQAPEQALPDPVEPAQRPEQPESREKGAENTTPVSARSEKPVSQEDEAAVRRALALGHIELFMQPIVSLPMRKPQFYEALTRLKTDDGDIITPDIFLPVCRKHNFLPMLDRLAINEAFRLLRRLTDRGHPVDIFCNLSLESLADSDFFALIRDLFDQNRDLAPHVILEFSQADMRRFGLMEEETLKLLGSMGFRLSVDRVTNLAAGFDEFAQKGVKFAKIAAPILTHREAGRGLDIHPADFSRLLLRKGMDLIVTHVESERDLVDLIDYNVHLAQGDHFAPAKALKGNPPTQRSIEQAGTVPQQQQALAAQSTSRPAAQPQAPAQPPVQSLTQPAPARGSVSRSVTPDANVPNAPRQPVTRPTSRAAASAQASLQPASAPRGAEQAQGTNGLGRTLGENPRIAQALRAMAADDDNNSETRDHFRAVLAEAAGLIGAGGGRGPRQSVGIGSSSAGCGSGSGSAAKGFYPAGQVARDR